MYIGIDIGTSGVKIVVTNSDCCIMASASQSFEVLRPHPLWSEQHPDLWWHGVEHCMDKLSSSHGKLLSRVRGIGLSGQMLGPVLVDQNDEPVRNTILWNDGRATEETRRLIDAFPDIGHRVGCRPNPNFVAPKIMWLHAHEPEVLERTACILLPKDYIFLKLTGERATEPTDSCGTHFMEAETATWAADLMEFIGIREDWLPRVISSYEPGTLLLENLAGRWGIPKNTAVAIGAGDNIAGAIGVGAGRPGDGVLSVGTSAVTSIVDGSYRPIPDKAVFTHPHAIPGTYLSMSVVLSATSCLDWAAGLMGKKAHELAAEAATVRTAAGIEDAPVFLPYVNGIRTPHDMPEARGIMAGLDLRADQATIGWSVLEGIAFHIVEAFLAQRDAGIEAGYMQFIGGGSRSRLWGEMIASLAGIALHLPKGREVGASMGAARFAMVASGDMAWSDLCLKPPAEDTIEPDKELGIVLARRFDRYRHIYSLMKSVI
jgi:xylulokinase